MTHHRLFRLGLVAALVVLVLAAALPGVSAETAALPTPRLTLGAGGSAGGALATAAAIATKTIATSQAISTKAAQVKLTLTPGTTTGAQAATTAITDYASSVLGIKVTVKQAGGLTGQVTRTISQTPKGGTAQQAVVKLAVITYGATLSNGAASLSYGTGTVTGNVQVDVQGSSLGVYSLLTTSTSTSTLDSSAALSLAKKTFPNLANFPYTAQTVTKGYAWYAKGSVTGYDTSLKKFVTLAEAVILYVLPGTNGKATVTATVGRGDFATAVKP